MSDNNVHKGQGVPNPTPDSTTWDKWYQQFSYDVTTFENSFNQMEGMIKAGDDPGAIIMFAMSVLFPDKMQLGEDQMSEQAYAIQDLSNITDMISKVQEDLQNGDYSSYLTDYNALTKYIGTDSTPGTDPWLQAHNTTIDGVPFNFEGLLGDAGTAGSALNSLIAEVGDPGSQTGLGALTNEETFDDTYYNLTGNKPSGWTPPPIPAPSGGTSPGPQPANPSLAQEYVNDFSQATSQVSSASSFANNQLQFDQQNYQKMTQAVQDTLSDEQNQIQQINQNMASA